MATTAQTITLTIDGKAVNGKQGQTIYEIASENGFHIPTMCYDKRLKPFGACRTCLVEVEGARNPLPSCTTPATNNMVIKTDSAVVKKLRASVLELLLTNHPLDCPVCDKAGECELQNMAYDFGVSKNRFRAPVPDIPYKDDHPFIAIINTRCILCGRCVRICDEVQGRTALGFINRGSNTMIGPAFGNSLLETECESCGQCVSTCPVGAIVDRPSIEKYRPWEVTSVDTTCGYCGVGCTLTLHVRNSGTSREAGLGTDPLTDPKGSIRKFNEVVKVTAPMDAPVNGGNLCVKGRYGYDFVESKERLHKPLIRKNGELVEASWEEALSLISGKFGAIKAKYGADALGFVASTRTTNEENYLVQKMARAGFGTNNVDNAARVCHTPSMEALGAAFGTGAATNSMSEIPDAELILLVGANPGDSHPVLRMKIIEALNKGAKLVVVDPRRTDLVPRADLWLNIKPGTNIALANAIAHVILKEGLENKEFVGQRTEKFDELKKMVENYSPDKAAQICGIEASQIIETARLYAKTEKAMILYGLGITEHTSGTQNVASLANLVLLTGKIGKPSAGINPLRGQNNVQGASDMGCLPDRMVGYQKLSKPGVIEKFEKAWNVTLPKNPGLTSIEMYAVGGDKIKGMYILGEDPAQTAADVTRIREGLAKMEFVVVHDLFLTETCRYAHVVLPATSFIESTGTFTNMDRRIQAVNPGVEPVAGRTNFGVIQEMATRSGYAMKYQHPKDVIREYAALADHMFGGVLWERIMANKGIQWPCPTREHKGTQTLHVGEFTFKVNNLGTFQPSEHLPSAEQSDKDFPFVLTTGRRRAQYNNGSMTRKTPGIMELSPEELVEINPKDAESLGIQSGDFVKIRSRRGELKVKANVTKKSGRGILFMSHHFSETLTNLITSGKGDTVTGTPEFKSCAVAIEKAS